MTIPPRHECGQFLGPRPHACPLLTLECPRGHLRAHHAYVKADGFMRCRECDRERRGRLARYFGTHCVKGHRKTAASWRWITDGYRCMDCRRLRDRKRAVRPTERVQEEAA